MELIDEGETDHKIIVLREDDPNFDVVHNMAGTSLMDQLIDQ